MAAHASAAPAPTLFRLTIVGTAHQVWTYTGGPAENGDCTQTVTSEGVRTATFRTKTPVIVRIAAGRALPVTVRNIQGTVTIGGAVTTEQTCAGVRTEQIADCAQSKRTFTKARLHAASPRRGVVMVSGATNVRLAIVRCPSEPPDVRQRPLGPPLNLLRLPKEALLEGRLGEINLRASRNRNKVYGSPAVGHLNERGVWKLELVRVKG